MKLRLLVASVVVCASVGPLRAAASAPSSPEQPPSLQELIRGWTRSTSRLPARPGAAASSSVSSIPSIPSMSRGDALAALLGGRRIDARCATPLLIALYQNGPLLNQPTRQLLEQVTHVPASMAGTILMSPGGEFRIHYSMDPASADRVDPYDGDLDGVPDGVERLGSELTDELADFVHVLHWPPTPAPAARGGASPTGTGVVEVYLVGSMGAAEAPIGFVTPRIAPRPTRAVPLEEALEAPDGANAAIYLDTRLASPSSKSKAAVAHMVAHMVLMRESARESPWWHEASATWLENRLEHDTATIAARYSDSSARPARGLSDGTLDLTLEAFLWPHYLMQGTGSDVTLLHRMWEEMASVPGNNTFEAMDRVLRRSVGTSLSEEIRVFNIWNLFLGQADDGRHYPFAGLLPTPQGDATYDVFPARGASLPGPVPPLGSSMLRLLGDGSQGGLRIRFFGGEPGEWDVSLIVYPAGQTGDTRHVSVELDSSGRGFIPVPWKGFAAIDLVIQNLSSPAAAPADYYFSVDYDPTVPYDLLSFTADESTAGAALTWSTESEERLAGWNIWRGKGPLGPFTRVNRFLVPGAGMMGQAMGYMYVDSSVAPGQKYYYYLEGVTLDGFAENSHPAGVRSGPWTTPSSSAH